LPVIASGLQIDRRCGSGLQAVIYAAMQVQTGASEVVPAWSAESMSNPQFYPRRCAGEPGRGTDSRANGKRPEPPGAQGMLKTLEKLRPEYSIARAEQDEYAARSHKRAAAAAKGVPVRRRDRSRLAQGP
jgi:acetyl-CoA C-acetyltransferase